MSLYIDLSEFLINPIRTGIQRISGEICRNLPSGSIIPLRLSQSGYVALPVELTSVIGSYFNETKSDLLSEITRLSTFDSAAPVEISKSDVVLVPEVFDNPQRLDFFRAQSDQQIERYRFIVYDLLPITHPEFFAPGGLIPICRYYQLLRRAKRCGFISEYTLKAYFRRLKRVSSGDGQVLPLGCDALGERASAVPLKRSLSFTVLGTVEPRKNHGLILDAVEPLLGRVPGLTLSFVGRMGWVDPSLAHRVHTLAADPASGFNFYQAVDDTAVRRCIEGSRATIYVSAAEGYGLPPVESLWVGTPVIASGNIPSLERLGSTGLHRVEPLNAINLRRAVLAFVDDAYASSKAKEAMSLNLPTWRSFTEEVYRWCLGN